MSNINTAMAAVSMKKNIKQPVGEIKEGDEKEIRIRRNALEQIITTSIKTAVMHNITFALCLFAYVVASINLVKLIG